MKYIRHQRLFVCEVLASSPTGFITNIRLVVFCRGSSSESTLTSRATLSGPILKLVSSLLEGADGRSIEWSWKMHVEFREQRSGGTAHRLRSLLTLTYKKPAPRSANPPDGATETTFHIIIIDPSGNISLSNYRWHLLEEKHLIVLTLDSSQILFFDLSLRHQQAQRQPPVVIDDAISRSVLNLFALRPPGEVQSHQTGQRWEDLPHFLPPAGRSRRAPPKWVRSYPDEQKHQRGFTRVPRARKRARGSCFQLAPDK